MKDDLSIGIGMDQDGWHRGALSAFERARERDVPVRATLIDLHAHDWVHNARGFDAIVWNPVFMGPISASFFKEKIHFLENVLGIRVMPNHASVWHFESKVAQSYLLEQLDVPRPRTVVSFDRADAAAAARDLGLPIVAKKSYGASSSNVRLLRTPMDLDAYLEREFSQQLWDERKSEKGSALSASVSDPLSPWFREKVRKRLLGGERHGYVYLQEFLPGNVEDVRVHVVGRRVAGSRRQNRPNDFRASGSGVELPGDDLPEDAIALCMRTRELIGADCLAFDVLRRDGEPVITEMCYAQCESADAAHWVREPDGSYTRIAGAIPDQELWARHLLDEFGL